MKKKKLKISEFCTQEGKKEVLCFVWGFYCWGFFGWVFFGFLEETLNTVAFLEYPITNLSSHYKHLRNVPSICLEYQL